MTKQIVVKILRRGLAAGLVLPLLTAIGCGSQTSPTAPSTPVVPTPTAGLTPGAPTTGGPTTGQLSFSSTASKGWTSIFVTVDGKGVGTLTSYVSNTTPSCVADSGRVVITVSPGTHTYTAQASSGGTWSGSATVSAGQCVETHLTCPNNDCSPATTSPLGQLAFSSTASRGWTSISVNVDGRSIGTLTAYVSNTTASCVASAGRVVVAVTPGAHTYSARSNTGATWNGSATVSAGGCTETQLTCQNNDCSPQTQSGGLIFEGPVSYRASGSSVALAVSKILNTRSSRTGSLRIDLWASTSPYAGTGELSGVLTASIRTAQVPGLADTLAPGADFSNIQMTLPYARPASQYSYYTVVLSEYSSTCTSADRFCIAAYVSMR